MPSQNPQQAGTAVCPGCGDPVESDDRFCGRCGTELPPAPAGRSGDRPTLAIGVPAPPPVPPRPAAPPGAPAFPAAGTAGAAGYPVPPAAGAVPAPGQHSVPSGQSTHGGTPPGYVPPVPDTPPGAAAPAVPAPAVPAPATGPAGQPGGPGAAPGAVPPPGQPPLTAGGTEAAGEPPRSRIAALAEMSGPANSAAAPAALTDHRAPSATAAPPPAPTDAYGRPAGPTAYTTGSGNPAGPGPDPSGQPAAGSGDFTLQPPPAPTAPPAPPAAAPATAPKPGAADPRSPHTDGGPKLCVACRAGRVDTDGYCENCGHAQPRERDHMEHELDSVAAVSDRGLRHHRNEDSFGVASTALPDGSPAVVAIVCDGVSSATRPDEASQAAARAARDSLVDALPRGTHPQQGMRDAIVAAAGAVNALAAPGPGGEAPEQDPHGRQNAPACTIVGAVTTGELLVVGWVGDSRVYWVPDDRSAPAARLTEDDSWAAQMVAAGLMSEAEAYADERAHAITGWLGADAYELDPHTAAFKPDRSGVVVVCTDGLWNYAEGADEMAGVVPADAAVRPLHAAQVLVGHALDGGGHDNVTVAVVPFAVGPQGGGPS
ncbi:PP2C family serine/threonine-protein phosphatase [Streptomyces sp. NPDC006798]|uniref:PP2C family serine/threonine-protein phosphatase n=1 Tax=Streptomyces sp. NPDC006798 TaxID=3155462 RepID=UPI0033FF6EFE